MKDITIRQRLIVLVAFLGIALVFIGVQALRNMASAVRGLETVYLDRVVPLKDLKAIADAYAVSIVDLSHKTRNGNVPWEEAQTRVATARKDRPSLVIGFAAETDNVEANARAKRKRKGCDWIVANDVSPATGIMGGAENAVTLITEAGSEAWPRLAKDEVARRLAQRIAEALKA